MDFEKETEKLNKKFLECCRSGKLDMVIALYNKYYLEHQSIKNKFLKKINLYKIKSPILDIHFNNNEPLIKAFEWKHFKVVNFLLTSKEFYFSLSKDQNQFTTVLSSMLNNALYNNNINMVNLFLPLIKNKNDIFYHSIMQGVSYASSQGNLEILKLLFKHPGINNQKLELYQDEFNTTCSQSIKFEAFQESCSYGKLDIVKFLTSSEINDPIDVNKLKRKIYLYCSNELEIINYLICDLGIEKENFIKYFSDSIGNSEKNMIALFEKHELYKTLKIEVKEKLNDEVKIKKMKV